MLSEDQKKYLETIPEGKVFEYQEYDEKAKKVAGDIISKLKEALPESQVFLLGSLELGIGGQNDIDITIVSDKKEDVEKISSLFGSPKNQGTLTHWELTIDDYPVEIYLNPNRPNKHIATIEILSSDNKLLEEYEELKRNSDGKAFREYMKNKYEFFNKLSL